MRSWIRIWAFQLPYFSRTRFQMSGVEINEQKISTINHGISTIGELGLDSRLSKVVQDKKLQLPI